MDKEMRAVVRCLHGIQEELCELREAIQDIGADMSDVEFIHIKGEHINIVEDCDDEYCDSCCDCEDCFEL